ncbi:hypothetical protein [uncultured Gimesia sp.]|uniref:hypothetical protein n=1 Tax=uncultured Gimesia sp. TaxID=1678688 RepID=UPI0030DB3E07
MHAFGAGAQQAFGAGAAHALGAGAQQAFGAGAAHALGAGAQQAFGAGAAHAFGAGAQQAFGAGAAHALGAGVQHPLPVLHPVLHVLQLDSELQQRFLNQPRRRRAGLQQAGAVSPQQGGLIEEHRRWYV